MKIGILTFHCAYNYGAVFQAYALLEFLRSEGFDVEIINYRPRYLLKGYSLVKVVKWRGLLGTLKDIVKETIIFPVRYRCWRGFKKFEKTYFLLSSPIHDISSIPSNYDAYIVGSDQVWNPDLTQGFDRVFFCDFSFEKGNRSYISYAPSIGQMALNDKDTIFIRKQLKHFNVISVREEKTRKLLSPLVNSHISRVLDPTLMVPLNTWNKLINTKNKNVEKYVVVYQAIKNKETLQIAHDIAKQLSAKVLTISCVVSYYDRKSSQIEAPEGFINKICNAACVITNSFHGTAFSIILNRPFYTTKFENEGWNVRSESLLNQLGLQNRMIDLTDTPIFSEIDYSLVNPKLDQLRKESQDFLISALMVRH